MAGQLSAPILSDFMVRMGNPILALPAGNRFAPGGPPSASSMQTPALTSDDAPQGGVLGGRMGPGVPSQDHPGILSKIAGFANRFGSELLHPTTPLGQLAMYFNAATGNDLGRAQYAAQQDQWKQENDQAERDLRRAQAQADFNKAFAPHFENIGGIGGLVDPTTGQFTTTFTPPTDGERYAASLGINKDTDSEKWNNALKDWALRQRGPSAFEFVSNLEDQRQSNRIDLENHRFGERATLRGMPTYGDTHPRPRAPAPPGGIPSPRPNSKSDGIPTIANPQDALKLAPGTVFRTPDGRMKVR